MDEGGSRNGVSLKSITAEGLKGGLLYQGPWVMKGRLWGWASLFMGAQLGNLEWAHLLGTLEVGHISLSLCGNLEGGLPCWGLWGIGRKGSGGGHLFP